MSIFLFVLIMLYAAVFAVPFLNREWITFNHLMETALLRVLRDGAEQEFSVILHPLSVVIHVFFITP